MGSKVDYTSLTDEELFFLVKEGYSDAFTEIFDRYWFKLIYHANNIVKDEDLAQDIVQDVFTWLYQNSKTFALRSSLSSYLYGAVRHGVLAAIRRKKVRVNYLESLGDYFDQVYDQADHHLNRKELEVILDRELEKMPPKMRQIFEMSRKQYLSHKQIAEQLNLSEHTVRNQIKRALSQLKKNDDLNSYVILASWLALAYY